MEQFSFPILRKNISDLSAVLYSILNLSLSNYLINNSIVSPSVCLEVMGPDAMILVFWMLSFKQLLSTLKEPCSAQEAILRAWSTVSNINPYKFRLRGYIGTDRSFHSGSDGKESACKVGDLGLIPGLGRSPGEDILVDENIFPYISQWIHFSIY